MNIHKCFQWPLYGLLKQSIRREVGVLFLAPGILGVVHVLFGLQMFGLFMQNTYKNIWAPFTIFFVLYFIYYVLTTWLYTGIVLKKRLWKSCPASSNKNSQSKIVFHIFELVGLITADASFWTPFKEEVVKTALCFE